MEGRYIDENNMDCKVMSIEEQWHAFLNDWFIVYKPVLEAEIEETRKEVDNQKFSLAGLEKKLQKLNNNTFEAYQDMKYDLLNLDETLKGLSWLSEPTKDVDEKKKHKGKKKQQ